MRRNLLYLALIAGLLALDQAVKFIIVKIVPLHGSIPIIPGFFAIAHIRNKGAIFGMFSRTGGTLISILLLAATLVALVLVVYYFVKTPPSQRLMKIALSLILAGAVGNQIDRVARGSVVDFLELHVKRFYWPTFNVADSCITIGAILLAAILVFRRT